MHLIERATIRAEIRSSLAHTDVRSTAATQQMETTTTKCEKFTVQKSYECEQQRVQYSAARNIDINIQFASTIVSNFKHWQWLHASSFINKTTMRRNCFRRNWLHTFSISRRLPPTLQRTISLSVGVAGIERSLCARTFPSRSTCSKELSINVKFSRYVRKVRILFLFRRYPSQCIGKGCVKWLLKTL